MSALADAIIWLRAGHMALYLVRRSLCVAAHSFQPASKPLRNAEPSDSDWVCKVCMCVQLDSVSQLVYVCVCVCVCVYRWHFVCVYVMSVCCSLWFHTVCMRIIAHYHCIRLKIAQWYGPDSVLFFFSRNKWLWVCNISSFLKARKQHCCSAVGPSGPSESYRIMFLSHTW